MPFGNNLTSKNYLENSPSQINQPSMQINPKSLKYYIEIIYNQWKIQVKGKYCAFFSSVLISFKYFFTLNRIKIEMTE